MSIAPPSTSPIVAGYRLDRYELLCPIAEGGMASVWIARQQGKHGFQRFVAIKTILPKYAAEPSFQNMFIDEARIASRIEHTHVTQILDVGEQHGVTYLVMEYVDGDAVSKIARAARKKGTRIPLGILLRIMADVSGGLHAAHELRDDAGQLMGVVHRDVSPQNVLVTTRGVAKLIDFGIAKARDRLSGETHADTLKGKVQYMAPEQALGRPVDRRADVWAVGAVLYHLISGKPPFDANNEIQILFMITSGRPPPPLPPTVPAPVRDVIKKALAQSPNDRYPTAADLQQALEGAIIQANLSTSSAAVATFLHEMVGDRAEKRKEAIAFGLKAAEEREKAAAFMRSNADQSGQSSVRSDTGRVGLRLSPAEPETSPTGQTIGSTALEVPLAGPRRGMTVAIAAAAAALLLVGILAFVAIRSSGSDKPAAAALGPSVTTAARAPSIPPAATTAGAAASASEVVPSTTPDQLPTATEPPNPTWRPRPRPAPGPASGGATKPGNTTTPTRNNYGF
ncbi:MAG TPA: serine/threonine-protein kinase [Polyangiaceae bacterium]|nr:serine/threonine-protein kinase [Polyangiaceae bacterium]